MDPATMIGVGLAFGAVFISMIMEGGNPASIVLPPAMLLVFLGTFGVAMACGLLKDATGALAAISKAFASKTHAADETVTTLVGFAATLGIIGTVLGLIHVLENLSEPEKLGHLIAGAFVATLWGVLTANCLWLPIGNKLKRVGELEAHHMELVMEGVLAVQAGANPRVIEQKLLSFLPAAERPESSEKAA